jgi:hypothetical protein
VVEKLYPVFEVLTTSKVALKSAPVLRVRFTGKATPASGSKITLLFAID